MDVLFRAAWLVAMILGLIWVMMRSDQKGGRRPGYNTVLVIFTFMLVVALFGMLYDAVAGPAPE